MIEFALVVGIVFLCIFGSFAAAIWSVDRMGVTAVAETAVRLAVQAESCSDCAGGGYTKANKPDLLNNSADRSTVLSELRSALPGTETVTFGMSGGKWQAGTACNGSPPLPAHTVGLCVQEDTSGAPAADFVQVRVTGCANIFVATFSAFPGCPDGVQVDVWASAHALVFEK